MRWLSAGERGSVVAEFAVAVPAVLLVLAAALGGVQLAGLQLRLQDAAADAARSLGRDESLELVRARAAQQVPGSAVSHERQGDLVCVRLSASPPGPVALVGIRVEAASCAVTGGR